MHRFTKRVTRRIAMALAVVAAISACSAHKINPATPANIPSIEATGLGHVLLGYGYTPVSYLRYEDGSVNTDYLAYVACGTKTVQACGADLHNEGTFDRPNIYAYKGVIYELEGPHDSTHDTRSYRFNFPTGTYDWLAQFMNTTPANQLALLGVMKQVAATVGEPTADNGSQAVMITTLTGINGEQITAQGTGWVQRA